MDDLISRQAAIDAFMTATADGDKAEWCKWVLLQLPSNLANVPDTNVGDMISRQAAIDAIESHIRTAEEPYQLSRADEVMNHAFEIAASCVYNLPSAQPEPRWIPVTEELPKEKDAGILKKLGTSRRSEYVLATVDVKGERMTVTACTYDGEWDWNMKYAFPDYKTVAWMPLPEPYRAERRTDD